jgi:hypothetical protein
MRARNCCVIIEGVLTGASRSGAGQAAIHPCRRPLPSSDDPSRHDAPTLVHAEPYPRDFARRCNRDRSFSFTPCHRSEPTRGTRRVSSGQTGSTFLLGRRRAGGRPSRHPRPRAVGGGCGIRGGGGRGWGGDGGGGAGSRGPAARRGGGAAGHRARAGVTWVGSGACAAGGASDSLAVSACSLIQFSGHFTGDGASDA